MNWIVALVYLVFAAVAFGKLPYTFFQQDEWAIFGNFLYWDKAHLNIFQRLFIYEQDTHLIPLSNLFSYLQFKAFGLNFFPYGVTSIVLHVVNSFLVYLLARQLTGKINIAFFAGFLFLINSIPHQAITWAATTIGTAGSTSCVLLALLFFSRHLENAKAFSLQFLVSLIFFLFALLFKETSVFLFIFYIFFWYLYTPKKTLKSAVVIIGIFVCFGVAYIVSRVIIQSFWAQTGATAHELSQPSVIVYIYRFFTNPVKIIAQSIMPVPIVLRFARAIVTLGYPNFVQTGAPDPYLVESIASDIVSFFVASLVGVFGAVMYQSFKRSRQGKLSSVLLLSLGFVVGSSFPFVVIPGKAGYISLFDGRHLYLTSIFTSIAISTIAYGLYTIRSSKRLILATILGALLLYVLYHGIKINRDLSYQEIVGSLRKSILSQITTKHPRLPEKVILFVESDSPYYGLPNEEPIVPFQSGFGQTLLVWYNIQGESFPACFFEKKYLYVLLSEDYKECEGRGFGYYRKFEVLKKALDDNALSPDEVIAFHYRSSTNTIKEITKDIQSRLQRK